MKSTIQLIKESCREKLERLREREEIVNLEEKIKNQKRINDLKHELEILEIRKLEQ